jgi:hypothetical protein
MPGLPMASDQKDRGIETASRTNRRADSAARDAASKDLEKAMRTG